MRDDYITCVELFFVHFEHHKRVAQEIDLTYGSGGTISASKRSRSAWSEAQCNGKNIQFICAMYGQKGGWRRVMSVILEGWPSRAAPPNKTIPTRECRNSSILYDQIQVPVPWKELFKLFGKEG